MDPNILIAQEPPKPSKFKRFINPAGVVLLLLILGVAAYQLLPNYLPKNLNIGFNKAVTPKLTKESTLQEAYKPKDNAVILSFKVNSLGDISLQDSQKTSFHIPPEISTAPSPSSDEFVYKTQVMSTSKEIVYSSWRAAYLEKDPTGGFVIQVLIPYQEEGTIKIFDRNEKMLFESKL